MVSILILLDYLFLLITSDTESKIENEGLNPYFTGLSILINGIRGWFDEEKYKSQSLFYWIIYSYDWQGSISCLNKDGLNPYFTGLSILIRSVKKAFYLLLLQSFFQTLKSSFFRFF